MPRRTECPKARISASRSPVELNARNAWSGAPASSILSRVSTVDPRSLPKTIEGFVDAWSTVETTWASTIDRARQLPEPALHERVNGEWSFVETLRHLSFVTDAWVGRTILGSAAPYHRLDLPPDHRIGQPDAAVDVSDWGIDVFAEASVDEVLDVRDERMLVVRRVLEGLEPATLQRPCAMNPAPGFPPTTTVPVTFCLDLVVTEEWAHHGYATRDLALLEQA
jgi:hypothetical protein